MVLWLLSQAPCQTVPARHCGRVGARFVQNTQQSLELPCAAEASLGESITPDTPHPDFPTHLGECTLAEDDEKARLSARSVADNHLRKGKLFVSRRVAHRSVQATYELAPAVGVRHDLE